MFSRILKPSLVLCRSVSTTASLRYKDPIYQIFLDKVREYRLKSPKGKPVDPGPEFEAELKEVTERLAIQYGGGEGVDMLEFPKFKLPDIDIDPISVDDLPENQPKPEKENKFKEVKAKEKGGDKEVKAKDGKKADEPKGKDEKNKKK
ncbi:ATP synthase-coupling factor 6, mitochondrial [Drosophila mauritiana]|uniref:ATP synthase-coupling factor 6, mitochondrial n=1 Tax=Drosophila mauritiana TaxID=7226 RepID=A0A6P8JS65_DROMA|nr:ATP synthase-coupling factor 6, mitochondrial [Drosophila mauritiana]